MFSGLTLPSVVPQFERASKIMEGLYIARTNEVARSFTRSGREPLAKSKSVIAEKDKVIRELMHSYKELELLYEWSRSTSAPPSCAF